jgi:hypothetical protein
MKARVIALISLCSPFVEQPESSVLSPSQAARKSGPANTPSVAVRPSERSKKASEITLSVNVTNPFLRNERELTQFECLFWTHPRIRNAAIPLIGGGLQMFEGEYIATEYFNVNRYYFEACPLDIVARNLFADYVANRYLAYLCIIRLQSEQAREEFRTLDYRYWDEPSALNRLKRHVDDWVKDNSSNR